MGYKHKEKLTEYITYDPEKVTGIVQHFVTTQTRMGMNGNAAFIESTANELGIRTDFAKSGTFRRHNLGLIEKSPSLRAMFQNAPTAAELNNRVVNARDLYVLCFDLPHGRSISPFVSPSWMMESTLDKLDSQFNELYLELDYTTKAYLSSYKELLVKLTQ